MADSPKPIERASVVDGAVDRLEREILRGRYRPGDVLPAERALATVYGITRTSLKHALVRLQQLGLIRTRHGVGSVVQPFEESAGADLIPRLVESDVAPDLFAEILEARTYVLAAFVRLAAKRRTQAELEQMERLVDELAAAPANDIETVQRIENYLVRLWVRASRNRAFQLVANSVSAIYRMELETFRPQFSDRKWLVNRLTEIVKAVADRDSDRAGNATERYFEEAARRLRKQRGR